ncbi:MAG TPA: 2-polyprenyl-3-methyl-6-methoxy-1,4-benzoquinone monooxygenase [Gammaproteobacteria bacterium]|jgi:ubiquinone biosynthesis monooxygenase Coq7|nr:2-polyprenyl-3-methyl-6-methoxy-1,4-benzoquinone monooxygenase [Gammaproteobacteria bacterium]
MKNNLRHYSPFDQLCMTLDNAMRAIANTAKTTERAYPGAVLPETNLSEDERLHAASLMRVNHAGEVSAQALYHGQALVSRSPSLKNKMHNAALEEGDHLHWCHQRIVELGSHTSYLNPFWYTGSFVIGVTAGIFGDRISLGFLAETENQVVQHLQNHLQKLPEKDVKSYAILQQMQIDEAHHRDDAQDAGAATLHPVIKKIMGFTSKIMVKMAYWV